MRLLSNAHRDPTPAENWGLINPVSLPRSPRTRRTQVPPRQTCGRPLGAGDPGGCSEGRCARRWPYPAPQVPCSLPGHQLTCPRRTPSWLPRPCCREGSQLGRAPCFPGNGPGAGFMEGAGAGKPGVGGEGGGEGLPAPQPLPPAAAPGGPRPPSRTSVTPCLPLRAQAWGTSGPPRATRGPAPHPVSS